MNESAPATHLRIVHRAAALLIGSELLSGKVRDENLHPLAATLRALGIELARVVVCSDDLGTIENDIRALTRDFDLVITSGGVGPTHDDVTIEGVARGLGRAKVPSPELRALLEAHYQSKLTEAHLAMSFIPEGAELLVGGNVNWPIVVADKVWIFPGVPELFRMKLSALRDHLRGPAPFFTQEIFCTAEEADIKTILDQLVLAHPDVEIGSYPKWFDVRYKTRLTFDSRSSQSTENAHVDALQRLSDRVTLVT